MSKKRITPELPEMGRGTWVHPHMRGLELRGNKVSATWTFRHRIDGKRVRDTVGKYPALTPAAAVHVAQTITSNAAVQCAAGADVLANRAAKLSRTRGLSLAEAFTEYRVAVLAKLRSGGQAEWAIPRVFGSLMPMRLDAIDTATVLRTSDAYARKYSVSVSAQALRNLKAFFGWAAERDMTENTLAEIKVGKTASRDRVLTLLELGRIWNALEAMGDTSASLATRMMIATGQRRNEAGHMRRAEVDGDLWIIPASRMKAGKANETPLNSLALDILGRTESDTYLVFPGRDNGLPFNGWSKFKVRLDKVSGVTDWRIHDFRRTFATRCADAGGDPIAADLVLAHGVGSTLSSVGARYQHSTFRDQKRAVLDLWDGIIRDAAARASTINVVDLTGRAST